MAATPPTGQPPLYNLIGAMNEPWPSPEQLAAATQVHRQGSFEIASRKLPISKSKAIDDLEKDIKISVPEMIFGDNLVSITHPRTGWSIEFNARDALDAVDKTGNNMLQVAYATEWSASREQSSAGIRDVVRPFDWSYSTVYKGTLKSAAQQNGVDNKADVAGKEDKKDSASENEVGNQTDAATEEVTKDNASPNTSGNETVAATEEATKDDASKTEVADATSESTTKIPEFTATNEPIPIELLKRRDPILFFDHVMLYESELDDNGISIFSVKVRVHEQRMLLLARLYMRLDNVVCRVRDTRIYVDFKTEVVTREYVAKELGFEETKHKLRMTGLRPDGITIAFRDANSIADLLPTIEHSLESVSLAP